MPIPYGRPGFPPVAGPVKGTLMAPEDQITLEQVENLKALPEQFKKGYKTSEFWISAVTGIIPVAGFGAAAFGVDIDVAALLATVPMIAPSIAYIFGRGWLKRKRVEAMTP